MNRKFHINFKWAENVGRKWYRVYGLWIWSVKDGFRCEHLTISLIKKSTQGMVIDL